MRKWLPFVVIVLVSVSIFGYSWSNDAGRVDSGSSSQTACAPESFTAYIENFEELGKFAGKDVSVPTLASVEIDTNVLGATDGERWVEVDLSDQMIYAWEGDKLVMQSAISSGLPWWPTPVGEYRVWIKLKSTKMEGGSGKYYYYLPNVPYVMFFEGENLPGWRGYGLHGAYWHNEFGTPRSHGCVNLPVDFAGRLYEWMWPVIPEGKYMVRSTEDNPGSRVVIHE